MATLSHGRPLRLLLRREDPMSPSLFARLDPSVVDSLHKDALRLKPPTEVIDGWNVGASHSSPPDFLPLAVTFSDAVTIYVSYNGGAAASNDGEEDILELPASLIPEGFAAENSIVQVAALASIQDADTLHVEPLTCEDWDLLEAGASFLEDGALLQQISVVYEGQTLPLWVGGNDAAWIRILPENFQQESVWPEMTQVTLPNCLRLVKDTRVDVSPKSRKSGPRSSPPLRVFPTREDYSPPTNEVAESLGKRQVSTTPGTVLANPATKRKIPGLNSQDNVAVAMVWNAANGSDEDSPTCCLLQIAFSNDVPENYLAIHRLTRARLDVVALVNSVVLRILSPIEVARRSTLRSHEGGEITFTKVEIEEIRTAKKWRYPPVRNSHLHDLLSTAMENSAENPSLHLDNEPVESGSFLLAPNQPNNLCRVSPSDPKTDETSETEEPGGDNRSAAGRWFSWRRELPQFGELGASHSSHHQNSVVAPTTMTYKLRSTSHLLNLLPEDSHIPTELAAYTDGTMGRIGDAVVYGDVGSGKTHTCLVLASVARFQRNAATFYLDCKRLKLGRSIRMKDILSEINGLFRDAASCVEALVILDNLEELAPKLLDDDVGENSAQSHQINPVAADQAKLIGDTIRMLLESYEQTSVIIACRDRGSVLPCVLEGRPFSRTVKSPHLTALERECILWKLVSPGLDPSEQYAGELLKSRRIGRKTEGFRPRDLVLLAAKVRDTLYDVEVDATSETAAACISEALESFVPLRQLSVSERDSMAVEWTAIGGLFQVKKVLTETILNPIKYKRIYDKAKIRLPRGVLLFGSPGCGKTYLVPALARKCRLSLFTCRGPELLDRYIGASEAKVRALFDRAADSSPSIIFFDEFDALAPKRGSDKTGVTDRIVNQLLTLLDGVEDSQAKGDVYVIATTSRPDIIDPALLRPGRLEKHVYVCPPESDEEYTDLILKIASRYSVDEELLESISSGRFVEEAKRLSPNFHRLCCADFKAAFDTAQICAVHELLRNDQTDKTVIIGIQHMNEAIGSTRPSLPEDDYAKLLEVYRPFRKDLRKQANEGTAKRRGELRTALR